MQCKYILATLLTCATTLGALAQGNASLPFLQLNSDVRTSAMGDAPALRSRGMSIYSDREGLALSPARLEASYTLALYPSTSYGRSSLNAVSLGFKVGKRQALMFGFRHWGGMEVQATNASGVLQTLHPRDYSIDLAYAQQIVPRLSASARVSYIYSYVGATAHAIASSLSLSWRDTLPQLDYAITAAIDHLGSKLQYGVSGDKVALPTSLRLGGSASKLLAPDHRLELGAGLSWVLAPTTGRELHAGLGAEYRWRSALSLRAGHHWGADHSYWTLGAGYDWRLFSLNAAYQLSSVSGMDVLRLGLSLTL